MKPEIIFEDDEILVVNKPSGWSSQADEKSDESVTRYFESPYIITRLDKRVSGLMILAKNNSAASQVTSSIQANGISKTYYCVVSSSPPQDAGTLIHWLLKDKLKAKVFDREVKGAKKAVLNYQVLYSSERYHLIKVEIETGRFHQIRAQLAYIGCPIVGDLKYGYKRNSPDGSIFLCCGKIEIEGKLIKIDLPAIWAKFGLPLIVE